MLSVISYNVMFNPEYFERRHKALLKLLKNSDADVICLQEVLAQIVDWLIKELSDIYSPVFTGLIPAGRPYGELIFVRKTVYTLQKTYTGPQVISFKHIDLEGKMSRTLQHAELEKDGETYNVMTFHLESMNCKRVRREQLKKIWKYSQGMPNVVCVGDTNITATEEYSVPENVLDAWEQTDRSLGEHTYFSSRFWDGDRKQRYDKAWYTSDLELIGFGILGHQPIANGVWISDHDGIYCEVTPK